MKVSICMASFNREPKVLDAVFRERALEGIRWGDCGWRRFAVATCLC